MTMNRRRLMLAIGAVLFGVGLGAAWALLSSSSLIIGAAGLVSMVVGAGLLNEPLLLYIIGIPVCIGATVATSIIVLSASRNWETPNHKDE